MSGDLYSGGKNLWALATWGWPRLHEVSSEGTRLGRWPLGEPPEGDDLVASGGLVIVAGEPYCLDRGTGGLLSVDGPLSRNGDMLRPRRRAIARGLGSPFHVFVAPDNQVGVIDEGGDSLVLWEFTAGRTPRTRLFTALGRCGILSSIALVGRSLVAVSHVFEECFELDARMPRRWKTIHDVGVAEPYLVAESRDRCVFFGKDEEGHWVFRDDGELVQAEGIPTDDRPVGFALSGDGYAILRESMGDGCSFLEVLRREGAVARVSVSVRLE